LQDKASRGFTEHYLTNTRACFARAPTASPIDFKITMHRFFAYCSHYHHQAIIYISVIHFLFKQEVTRTERTRWVGGDSIERSERKSEDVKTIWRLYGEEAQQEQTTATTTTEY
jgi:hypothetical protein